MPHTFKAKLEKVNSWTIVMIPLNVKKIFGAAGHVRVKGMVDHLPFAGASLMPMGDGKHFLPIKSEIRKGIKKEAGDKVEITLEKDTAELEIPSELTEAFKASPEAKKMFESYSYSHKKNYAVYINESRKKETREKRAVDSVLKLEQLYFEKRASGKQKNKSKEN